MIDDSRGFTDGPPPYQSVLQSSSEVNLSHTPDPPHTLDLPQTSSSSRKLKRLSRWFPTSIVGLSKTANRQTATDVDDAAPLVRVDSAEVRSTTQDVLRDLLSQARPSEHEWLSLLSNCADTCNARSLSFSALLQEPFVEGHLPIYWAILKRPPATAGVDKKDYSSFASKSDPDALVRALLDASLPINAASVADARLACVTVSDNALFVRLG
jgi:hypothetical protein